MNNMLWKCRLPVVIGALRVKEHLAYECLKKVCCGYSLKGKHWICSPPHEPHHQNNDNIQEQQLFTEFREFMQSECFLSKGNKVEMDPKKNTVLILFNLADLSKTSRSWEPSHQDLYCLPFWFWYYLTSFLPIMDLKKVHLRNTVIKVLIMTTLTRPKRDRWVCIIAGCISRPA